MGQPLCRCLAPAAAVVLAACRPPSPPAEPPAAPVMPEEQAAQEQRYEDLAARLAPEGTEAMAALTPVPDPAHGAVFYQGPVAATGSTAYLRLVQLGQSGARALRLVVRYAGSDWIGAEECAVTVDDRMAGSFRTGRIRAERTTDGVVELLDADADTIRPVLAVLLEGRSAEIILRGSNGSAVIPLGPAELDEMRKVFAASLR